MELSEFRRGIQKLQLVCAEKFLMERGLRGQRGKKNRKSEDPAGKTAGSRIHVQSAKRWETLSRALRDRGYAIVADGGGQRIVRIRPRKTGAGSPEIFGGKWGVKVPKNDPEGME